MARHHHQTLDMRRIHLQIGDQCFGEALDGPELLASIVI
jgi:hypothetical protein